GVSSVPSAGEPRVAVQSYALGCTAHFRNRGRRDSGPLLESARGYFKHRLSGLLETGVPTVSAGGRGAVRTRTWLADGAALSAARGKTPVAPLSTKQLRL